MPYRGGIRCPLRVDCLNLLPTEEVTCAVQCALPDRRRCFSLGSSLFLASHPPHQDSVHMRRSFAFFVVAACAACGGGSKDSSPVDPGNSNPVATNAVSVNDNSFSPRDAEVAPNTPVTWTWQGAAQHNVTFEDGKEASGTKASGTHARTFGTAGTYRYRCTIHSSSFTSGMVGSVVVR